MVAIEEFNNEQQLASNRFSEKMVEAQANQASSAADNDLGADKEPS